MEDNSQGQAGQIIRLQACKADIRHPYEMNEAEQKGVDVECVTVSRSRKPGLPRYDLFSFHVISNATHPLRQAEASDLRLFMQSAMPRIFCTYQRRQTNDMRGRKGLKDGVDDKWYLGCRARSGGIRR